MSDLELSWYQGKLFVRGKDHALGYQSTAHVPGVQGLKVLLSGGRWLWRLVDESMGVTLQSYSQMVRMVLLSHQGDPQQYSNEDDDPTSCSPFPCSGFILRSPESLGCWMVSMRI